MDNQLAQWRRHSRWNQCPHAVQLPARRQLHGRWVAVDSILQRLCHVQLSGKIPNNFGPQLFINLPTSSSSSPLSSSYWFLMSSILVSLWYDLYVAWPNCMRCSDLSTSVLLQSSGATGRLLSFLFPWVLKKCVLSEQCWHWNVRSVKTVSCIFFLSSVSNSSLKECENKTAKGMKDCPS